MELSTTQRKMIACSLEIDGRPDVAASAVVAGHVSEFTYKAGRFGHVPASAKAEQREAIRAAIAAAITARGLPAVIAEFR